MTIISLIFNNFFSLTIKVIPYFVVGIILGAALKTYFKPEWAAKYFNGNILGVINASLLGAILPGCSCTTMPMAEGLKSNGGKIGTLTAFVIISPLLSPITLFLTFGMLGWRFTAARMVFPFIFSILVGLFLNKLEEDGLFLKNEKISLNNPKPTSCAVPEKKDFWLNFLDITKDLSKFFLLGMFIAAVASVLVPENSIGKYIAKDGILAYLSAALIGIPLYVCEGEEVPLTYALLKMGLGEGPAFTFLLGSVGTCVPTIFMAQKIIGKKATLIYVVSWFVFSILFGYLFSVILAKI